MMSLRHGWGWQPTQTDSCIHIIHIQSVWAQWYADHGHMAVSSNSYTHTTWLRFWGSVLSILVSTWTKNKEWCFLCKWRRHAWKNSLFKNYEHSFRLESDSQSMDKDHVYCIGFYTISYIRAHIRSWHTWPAGKETTSCTRVHLQDWRWIGYIFNSNPCNLILSLIPPGVSWCIQDIPPSWGGDLST
jgi:hypothetical protein